MGFKLTIKLDNCFDAEIIELLNDANVYNFYPNKFNDYKYIKNDLIDDLTIEEIRWDKSGLNCEEFSINFIFKTFENASKYFNKFKKCEILGLDKYFKRYRKCN